MFFEKLKLNKNKIYVAGTEANLSWGVKIIENK